ncbi:MAG: hypothetical protein ACRD32_07750, partial [Nitrososphaerales archaeon]
MGRTHITRNKRDQGLYSGKMYMFNSKFFAFAAVALVATMVIPLSHAQLDRSDQLVKITANSWKTIT